MGGVEVEIHAFLITALRGSKWLPNPTAVSSAPREDWYRSQCTFQLNENYVKISC